MVRHYHAAKFENVSYLTFTVRGNAVTLALMAVILTMQLRYG